MAKAAATGHDLSLVLFLILPVICLGSSQPTDAASLCYRFTVDNPGHRQWSYEVRGQLNKETFLSYNGNNNCHVFGVPRNTLNATNICKEQVDTLKHGADLFREQVIHMKQENKTIKGPLILQATMCCWHEVDGHFNGSWGFDLNGHKMFHVDSITGQWTEVDPGSSWMKKMWEKNRVITEFLKMTSRGDCKAWLKEIKTNWEEKLESTASPTAAPDVHLEPSSMAIKPNISILLIILPYSILLWFLRRILDNEG